MMRHALRTIARMPGLAAVVILSLGVGIGVNTTVFSWIQAVLLKPIPGVGESGSFYHIEPKSDTGSYPGMSWTEYRDLRPRLRSIGFDPALAPLPVTTPWPWVIKNVVLPFAAGPREVGNFTSL